MTVKQTIRQWIKFAIVGFVGVIVNGIVFAIFSQFNWGQTVLFDIPVLDTINLAWGIGILVAMVNNFILNKVWVFKK